MTHVFDTNSLMGVLLDDGTPGIELLFDEAGNVPWKDTQRRRRIARRKPISRGRRSRTSL